MSGHSKWSKIKRAKAATDAARGAIFTKVGRAITVAASEGGGDPEMNFSLRLAIEKAKEANMPQNNIGRSIKRGTGEIEGVEIQTATYEAYGPGGSALLIDTQTDNTNRTVADIRKIIDDSGGKMADSGSVSWQFTEKGLITVVPAKLKESEKYGKEDAYQPVDKEEIQLELLGIDGIEDIQEVKIEDEDETEVEALEVFTSRNNLAKVREGIEKLKLKVESAELIKVAKDNLEVEKEAMTKIAKLVDTLEEHEDVQSV
ncbi:MAG TPA: YebC/PmpR family DNA-binding transcriptional regulator, partial [bacterium]|nr:YebC/PmpR family DNA-binding transcriptional regulator [bacterium]